MSDVVVCIPWQDSGEPARQAALDYVTTWWSAQGFPWVTAGTPGRAPFNLSASRNAAAEVARTVGAKVLIFADADTIPGARGPIIEAVYQARMCPGAVYPHDHYWSLTERATRHVIEHGITGEALHAQGVEGRPYRTSVAGVIVTTVDSWEAAGRWDTAFQSWGGEDVAFALMARDVLGRALRMSGHLFHLWHPRTGYPATEADADDARTEMYANAALQGPHALRALRKL